MTKTFPRADEIKSRPIADQRTITVQGIAINFIHRLNMYMTTEQWEQFTYENQLWLSQGLESCPSHNHLDANEVMAEIIDLDGTDERYELINDSWDLARQLLRDMWTRSVIGKTS